MNIESYSHYLEPLALSGFIALQLWIFRRFLIEKLGYVSWIHLNWFVMIYFTIVWCAFCRECLLESRLMRFDLNRDGNFSQNEITYEQQEALRVVAKDLARKLTVYTGLIYSGLITSLIYTLNLIKNAYR